MDKICKYLLYEIAVRLNLSDIKNFSLVCQKYANITRDPYFWNKKRSIEYPNIHYKEDVTFSEKNKYINIVKSGYLYYSNPVKPYIINGQKKLIKKFYVVRNSFDDGLLVLTFDGELYMIDVDILTRKYIGHQEKNYIILGKNIYDVYYHFRDTFIIIQDEIGNLQAISQNGRSPVYDDIFRPNSIIPKKYDICLDGYEYILSTSNELYITQYGEFVESMEEIKDFMVGKKLYYLSNKNELWIYPKYGSSVEDVEEHILCENVLKFSVNYSDKVAFIDINGYLYESDFLGDPKKIEENVDFVKNTGDSLFYTKTNIVFDEHGKFDIIMLDDNVVKVIDIDKIDDVIFFLVQLTIIDR